MIGIVGLVTRRPRQHAERELARMVGAVCRESGDEAGTFVDERLGLYLGWAARTAVPVRNEGGDATLLFSGEEFPAPGTRRGLQERGHRFDGHPRSHLVHQYEEDPDFIASLNGRFHGVLVDGARGTATLFNDRYGLHRIYYYEPRDGLYFAAEAKSILAVRPECRAVDPQSLAEFVACRCVLEHRTIFTGIHVLPPAAAWVFHHHGIDKRAYFRPAEWEEQAPLSEDAAFEGIRQTFSTNLHRYFGDGERVGMSLTGGLDTRMIMAWRRPVAGALPCYSFAGMYRDSQDVIVARRVAAAAGQSHAVIRVGEEFLGQFPRYAERTVSLTDGCADVSHAPDLYVNERAADIAPIRMSGNYGGEVLRGVRVFTPIGPSPGFFKAEVLRHIQTAREIHADMLAGHPLSSALFRQLPARHYGLLALEQSQVSMRSPYLDNDLVQATFRAPPSLLNDDLCLRLIAAGSPALLRIRTDRGVAGRPRLGPLAPSRAWLEFTFKAEYAYDYGMPPWLAGLDHRVSRLRPERLFLGRHKFKHFRVWYRDALSDYVRGILLDPRTLARPYLDRRLEQRVRQHLSGASNYTSEIHTVLTLELMHRLFIDAPPAVGRRPQG